ncbi:MAG: hypothetical protein U1F15_01990 [Burkholderiales bacterium]
MSTVFAERPHFFEGQYLGAEDLEELLGYVRDQAQRHLLGAHTWGIVAGIDVASRTTPASTVEYFLTPGVAVDGYGRVIVVATPFKLDAALFAGAPTGLANVWIRYEQAAAGGVRRGFEVCDAVDAYARVTESFAVETGLRTTVETRQSGVALGDVDFNDAREALGNYLPGQPIACDGSVGAQLFPGADDPDLWLIPVGRVPWQQGAPGTFGAATEAARKQSLLFRRQAGVVAESIYAANGLLRLRPRFEPRKAGLTVDQICAQEAVQEKDLVACGGAIVASEPLWLEAHARFTGDARLFGTRMEWQEAAGTDYLNGGTALALRRRAGRNELNGFDLQLLLGKRNGADGPTRLVIGEATANGDPCAIDFAFTGGIFVQEDAKLGVGTAPTMPPKALTKPLEIRTIGDNGDAIGLQGANGAIVWQVNLGPGKGGLNFTQGDPATTNFFVATGGNVGIGTLAPAAKLDVRQVPAPGGGSALGAGKWLQLGDGGDAGRVWYQYGGQLAPLMVMSDLDNPPRIQFQQIGAGTEEAPQFASWIGQARPNATDLALMGGPVGVNTTSPSRPLHVEGEAHSGGAGAGFSFANRETGSFIEAPPSGERWVWYARGNAARLWSNGDKVTVTAPGNVGIATDAPAERLDVRGNVKLGASGNYFAVGAPVNVKLIAGSVPENAPAAGDGWSASHTGEGTYHVDFSPPFQGTPVVVVTLVNPLAEDNVICVTASGQSGFNVVVRDIEADSTEPQNSAFNFIAIGARA